MEALALRAHEKGLELTTDVSGELPARVRGDPGRLRQVLINLVGNAIKFTDRGEVLVSARVQQTVGERCRVEFAVEDTGPGIAPEGMQRLFRTFGQLDSSTTRKYGGTGLGLAISKQLVEKMGGTIRVQSTPGQGSTFTFEVPFIVTEPAPRQSSLPVQGPVLVVAPHDRQRRALAKALRNWNLDVALAEDVPEALQALGNPSRNRPFAVALIDADMQPLSGFEAVTRIQADASLRSTAIVMMTASDAREDWARCRHLGVAAFVLKPVRQTALRQALLSAASGVRLLPHTPLVHGHDEEAEEAALPSKRVRRPMRVLLAEDNLVNQRLVIALLQRQNWQVQAVSSGQKAVEAAQSGAFDVVLMDVQMPELDGLQATALIRQHEQGTGRHVPIIGLTAHAMKGDRERCLKAGMDGYLSKPIVARELVAMIESLVDDDQKREPETPAVDLSNVMELVSGDEELIRELVTTFLTDYPSKLEQLGKALTAADAAALERAAHSLKGSVALFGAAPARSFAAELERLGRESQLDRAATVLAQLQQELERVRQVLGQLQPQHDLARTPVGSYHEPT